MLSKMRRLLYEDEREKKRGEQREEGRGEKNEKTAKRNRDAKRMRRSRPQHGRRTITAR